MGGTAGTVGSSGTPLTVASASNFAAGDAIKVCLPAAGCAAYAYRVIRSVSGTDLVLNNTVTTTATGGAVTEVPAYPSQANPTWSPVVSTVSSITAGGLYSLDLTPTSGNVLVTVYNTDPNELASAYSYLNQRVNIFVLCSAYTTGSDAAATCTRGGEPYATSGIPGNSSSTTATAGTWIQATDAAGNDEASTGIDATPNYLTLSSGFITFILKGGYIYNITVDSGTLYTLSTSSTDNLSPEYFVTLDPA